MSALVTPIHVLNWAPLGHVETIELTLGLCLTIRQEFSSMHLIYLISRKSPNSSELGAITVPIFEVNKLA